MVHSAAARTQAAIAHGARATGTDFNYLLAQAKLESGLDPDAKASTSSATGLFQFIDSTWLATLDRHGAAHGMEWASGAIHRRGGHHFVTDPALRQQIFGLRHNPAVASVMAGALAQDNRAALLPVLGREPDAAELYLAHFLGAGGATSFLTALRANPFAPAAALLPEAAAANRGIFYADGAARTLGGVMDLIRDKVGRAMGEGSISPGTSDVPLPPATRSRVRPVAGGPAAFAPGATASGPSMAALLEKTFGLGDGGGGGAAPAHVRAAYGKLKAFGL